MIKATLLIVDDEADIRDLLRDTLEEVDYRCLLAGSGAEALEILEREPVDLVLSDMRMPGMSGAQLLEGVARRWPDTIRMVLTGYADLSSAVDAINQGRVHAYLEKPWDPPALLDAVGEQIAAKHHVEDQARVASERLALIESQRERAEQLFQAITTTTRDAVVMIDNAGAVSYWNQGAAEMFGYAADEAVGRPLGRLVFPERLHEGLGDDFGQSHERNNGDRPGRPLALVGRHRDGREFPVEVAVSALGTGDGQQSLGVIRDISGRVRAERNFKTLISATHTGMLILDRQDGCLFANQAAEQLLGRTQEQLVGAPFDIPLANEGVAELDIIGPGGSQGIAELSVAQLVWDGRPARLVMLHDITQRKAAENRIREMAFRDALTELPNRSLFYDRLNQALKRARRGQHKVAVLFVDLDRFKPVNDNLGHGAGDRLLQEVARRLNDVLREVDSIARFGGDEFLVLMSNPDTDNHVLLVADKIRTAIAAPYYIHEEEVRVTASVGLSLFPEHGADPDSLIRHADAALRAAKQAGRNVLRRYESRFESRVPGMLRLEASLHRALERGEFVLYFQPQVDVATGRMVGTEALLRWDSPERGLVAPGEFIPLLEESGLIHDVGEWVLRSACRQNRAWQAAGWEPLRVAVNLSSHQLVSGDIVGQLEQVLRDTGLQAQWLELEVTETNLMRDLGAAREKLHAIDAMGVSVALDDFGTGYSSLSYLNELKCDRLKIDRAFVKGLPEDRHGSAISSAVVAMSRALRFETLAEGVEESKQLSFLSGLGCDAIQGFLFSRPLPAAELEGLLNDNPPARWVALCEGRELATDSSDL